MARLLALATLILSLVLFPPATLAYLSQDAVPGDRMYPIKRGFEDVILTVTSINPWSKAFVATARSARRYREAQALLARGSSEATKTLNELVTQTSSAAEDIQKIANFEQKQALIAKLSKEIETFDKGLSEVQAKTVVRSTPETAASVVASPSPVPSPTFVAVVPTPSPSPTLVNALPSPSPSPVVQPPAPTPSPVPTHPVVASQAEDIEKTRKELEKIKRKLEEESRKHKDEKKQEIKEENKGKKTNLERLENKAKNIINTPTFNMSGFF